MDIIRIIFAIILPPLGVFLQEGLGKQFWLNILLTILGYGNGRRASWASHCLGHGAAAHGKRNAKNAILSPHP